MTFFEDKEVEYSIPELTGLAETIERSEGMFTKKSPNAIIAVYDLAIALHKFDTDNNPLPDEVDFARVSIIKEFIEHLKLYNMTDKKDEQGKNAAFDTFKIACIGTLKTHYKGLSSEPSLWNAIKDLFNDLCKALHISPKATLDASTIGKDAGIEARFIAIEKENIEAPDVNEIEHTRRKPQ